MGQETLLHTLCFSFVRKKSLVEDKTVECKFLRNILGTVGRSVYRVGND